MNNGKSAFTTDTIVVAKVCQGVSLSKFRGKKERDKYITVWCKLLLRFPQRDLANNVNAKNLPI